MQTKTTETYGNLKRNAFFELKNSSTSPNVLKFSKGSQIPEFDNICFMQTQLDWQKVVKKI